MIKLLVRLTLDHTRGDAMEAEHVAAALAGVWIGGSVEHGDTLYEVIDMDLEEVEVLVTEH